MIRVLVLISLFFASALSRTYAKVMNSLPNGTQIVFLDAESGYDYILRSSFCQNMSALDVSLRLKEDLSASSDSSAREKYSAYLETQVRNWNGFDKRYLRKRLRIVAEQIARISTDVLPDTLYLIRTTGDQEFNATYTLGKAIVFPGVIRTASTWLPIRWLLNAHVHKTLIHELFHVYSTTHPEMHERLYRIIGFSRIGEINLHPDVKKMLILNPDDKPDWYMISLFDEETQIEKHYVLLIMSKYPTWVGNVEFPSVFSALLVYLDTKLHLVEYEDGEWHSSLDSSGNPILRDKRDLPDFLQQTGLHNEKTLSPEEIIAEYWVYLVESTVKPKALDNLGPVSTGNLNEFRELFGNLSNSE